MIISDKRKILARILKGCVKEYENISLKDIETKYIQREEFIENREIDGENKIKKLEEEYRLEMEYEYREVFSKMCNLSEVYTEQGYRSGVEDGIEIGVERGIGIGMEIGEDKGKLKILKSLVDNGTITLETAAENAQMTVEEFEEKIRNIDK